MGKKPIGAEGASCGEGICPGSFLRYLMQSRLYMCIIKSGRFPTVLPSFGRNMYHILKSRIQHNIL